ncbi:MAG: hypothetical protein HZB43_10470, partial [candidate division Zixibacteria bacterium]|nr:hypothetical protein [candidate division Zixibacteria bacterium]
MFKHLLPRETGFFDFFEQHIKLSIAVCREMDAIALNPGAFSNRSNRIKENEHDAANITHTCSDPLHPTYITRTDRG